MERTELLSHFGLWSCRLARVIPSFSGKVVVIVAGACIEVWWLHVCGLARVAAVCSPESVVYGCAPLILVASLPLLNHPHFIYRDLL